MSRPWDKRMKRLFSQAPQDFVEWLMPGATYLNNLSSELENETLYADLLFEVMLYGVRTLLHIEFQRNRDAMMAERLWEYNMKATRKYNCVVWSVVIYLKDDGSVPLPPLTRELANGRRVHIFDYDMIRLWDIPTEELKRRGRGFLPLLTLSKEGARRQVVEDAIESLVKEEERVRSNAELLILTYGFASLVLESEDDQRWLNWRFGRMFDLLRESPAFQEIRKEGRQEGLEALRQTLVEVVTARFPKIARLARGQAAITDNPEMLKDLIVKMSIVQSVEEAQHYLIDWPETDSETGSEHSR